MKIGMPLEQFIVMLLKFAITYRETMEPDVRARWDRILIEDVEMVREHMKATGEWLSDRLGKDD